MNKAQVFWIVVKYIFQKKLFSLSKLTVTLTKLGEGGIQDSQVFTINSLKKKGSSENIKKEFYRGSGYLYDRLFTSSAARWCCHSLNSKKTENPSTVFDNIFLQHCSWKISL